jgi:hypothetical protein
MSNIGLENFPWIFWLRVSIRKHWFSYMWSTRGANFIEFQFWIFRISIGRPWKHAYLNQENIIPHLKLTNDVNFKSKTAFQIGNYKKFEELLKSK